MSIKIKCTSCKTEYSVLENKLNKELNPTLEKAFCPKCKTEIYSIEIDGWLTVEAIGEKDKNADKCVYPMP
jgi:Zn finger protein HypA/HybF involved in hydrogenase expression